MGPLGVPPFMEGLYGELHLEMDDDWGYPHDELDTLISFDSPAG